MKSTLSFECAFPIDNFPVITLGHGGGGRLTQQLLDNIIRPAFKNPLLDQQHDSTFLYLPSQQIAITTDSYVVDPLFFPESNIGELAVNGTINDLAMSGAKPTYITCSFILTEGLPIDIFIQVVEAIRTAALKNQVQIVAGDIKVVEKTREPSLYINTTGVGIVEENKRYSPQKIQENDAIIISNDIGRHGLSILAKRHGLDFQPAIASDCASLWPIVEALKSNVQLHCLRDLTRGGLTSALTELAITTGLSMIINERDIPVTQGVHAACEILGLDPLYIANEGCMILFSPRDQVESTLKILHTFDEGRAAAVIGHTRKRSGTHHVILKTVLGSERPLTLFSGEQLPRIC